MGFLNKIVKRVYRELVNRGAYDHLSDEAFLKKQFYIRMGKELDLNAPRTFNEKLQWLKLYNRRPEYTTMVDKYEAKKYVAECIGEEHIIPTLGVWHTFEEIDFSALPDQFVLKCTHDSGGLVICRDKSKFDAKAAKKKIGKSLRRNFYLKSREWPYKNVKPRIIAEQFMEDRETRELRDYKFFCFDGEPKVMFIATDRQTAGQEVKFDFFDMDYKHLDVRNGHANATNLPKKPAMFEEMKALSKKLSKGIPHVRVDFYEIEGKVFFGELTFFHFSGMVPFEPEQWDYTFGDWIKLPSESTKDLE